MAASKTLVRNRTAPLNGSGSAPEEPEAPIELAEVPEASYAKYYVSRQFTGIPELSIYDKALGLGMNVLNEGPTGCGKTMSAQAWAASRSKRFYSVPSNIGVEPSQLFGKLIRDTDMAEWVWQDGPVTDLVRNGGLLLVNEINFLPPKVATVLFSLLDKRRVITLLDHRGEVVKAHRPNCWCDLDASDCHRKWLLVIGDMNPGYAGTTELNTALRNRFSIQLTWDYDDATEDKLIKGQNIRRIAKTVRKLNADGEVDTPMSTNLVMEFETHVKEFSLDFAIENLISRFLPEERDSVRKKFEVERDVLRVEYEELFAPSVDEGYRTFVSDWVFPE